jgi:hypothetical protein
MARDQREPVNRDGQLSAADLRAMAEQAAITGGMQPGAGGTVIVHGWGMSGSDTQDATGPAGGDLSGYYPDPTVVGLQGNSVADTAPSDGQVLTWSAGSSEWQPASVAAGSITIEEVDGTPSVANVNSISFDQTDGFAVSDLGGGAVRIDLRHASATQDGIINTSGQFIAGQKSFLDSISVEYDSTGGMDYNLALGGPSGTSWIYSNHTGLGVTPLLGLRVPSDGAGTDYIHWVLDGRGAMLVGSDATDGAGDNSWPALRIQNDAGTIKEGTDRTVFGLPFVSGVLVATGSDVASVDLTSEVTGALPTGNGGIGLTTTPPAGSVLAGDGSGYVQTPAHILVAKWTLTV